MSVYTLPASATSKEINNTNLLYIKFKSRANTFKLIYILFINKYKFQTHIETGVY